MRAFILTFALTLPIGLAACSAEPEQTEYEEDLEEARVGPIEEELDQELTGYSTYDADGDGLFSEDEYNTGIGDGAFGTYDTDADGYLSEEEYTVYETNNMDM